jgi:hypothetical protein
VIAERFVTESVATLENILWYRSYTVRISRMRSTLASLFRLEVPSMHYAPLALFLANRLRVEPDYDVRIRRSSR